jgi:hypothetical protein
MTSDRFSEGVDGPKQVEHQPNLNYLRLVTFSQFTSTMQFGAGLSASGQTFMPLSVQLNWSEDDMDSNIALLTSSCSYGIAFGSILSG